MIEVSSSYKYDTYERLLLKRLNVVSNVKDFIIIVVVVIIIIIVVVGIIIIIIILLLLIIIIILPQKMEGGMAGWKDRQGLITQIARQLLWLRTGILRAVLPDV